MFHLDKHTLHLMLWCVIHKGRITEETLWEERAGLGGEDDDDICDGRDEGDAPDQGNKSVGSMHSTHVSVKERVANSNVTFYRHASQVQRAVPDRDNVIWPWFTNAFPIQICSIIIKRKS